MFYFGWTNSLQKAWVIVFMDCVVCMMLRLIEVVFIEDEVCLVSQDGAGRGKTGQHRDQTRGLLKNLREL